MGKHKRFQSVDGQSSSGAGDARKTAGHPHLGLFVVARNLDTASDTLTVRGEISHNEDDFTHVNIGTTQNDDVLTVNETDFVQSDDDATVFTAYRCAHNVPVEYVRANVVDFTDDAGGDLEVDCYLFVGGWTGPGKSFNERTDFA